MHLSAPPSYGTSLTASLATIIAALVVLSRQPLPRNARISLVLGLLLQAISSAFLAVAGYFPTFALSTSASTAASYVLSSASSLGLATAWIVLCHPNPPTARVRASLSVHWLAFVAVAVLVAADVVPTVAVDLVVVVSAWHTVALLLACVLAPARCRLATAAAAMAPLVALISGVVGGADVVPALVRDAACGLSALALALGSVSAASALKHRQTSRGLSSPRSPLVLDKPMPPFSAAAAPSVMSSLASPSLYGGSIHGSELVSQQYHQRRGSAAAPLLSTSPASQIGPLSAVSSSESSASHLSNSSTGSSNFPPPRRTARAGSVPMLPAHVSFAMSGGGGRPRMASEPDLHAATAAAARSFAAATGSGEAPRTSPVPKGWIAAAAAAHSARRTSLVGGSAQPPASPLSAVSSAATIMPVAAAHVLAALPPPPTGTPPRTVVGATRAARPGATAVPVQLMYDQSTTRATAVLLRSPHDSVPSITTTFPTLPLPIASAAAADAPGSAGDCRTIEPAAATTATIAAENGDVQQRLANANDAAAAAAAAAARLAMVLDRVRSVASASDVSGACDLVAAFESAETVDARDGDDVAVVAAPVVAASTAPVPEAPAPAPRAASVTSVATVAENSELVAPTRAALDRLAAMLESMRPPSSATASSATSSPFPSPGLPAPPPAAVASTAPTTSIDRPTTPALPAMPVLRSPRSASSLPSSSIAPPSTLVDDSDIGYCDSPGQSSLYGGGANDPPLMLLPNTTHHNHEHHHHAQRDPSIRSSRASSLTSVTSMKSLASGYARFASLERQAMAWTEPAAPVKNE
ncbi:hypothetical protein BC828DRAFT_114754 [Blastocladiella britannica]|nr:hypothetical protein BC828DRAFT_114754 [Blastocladiella britannica]